MASKHREQNIIAAVACPVCGAAVGQPCGWSRSGNRRPACCPARRVAWQQWKREHGLQVEGGPPKRTR